MAGRSRRIRVTGRWSKGVCFPRQLLVDPRASPVVWLVPNTMSRNPRWLELLRRALSYADARRLFPRLHRTEGAPRTAEHQALLHDVLRGLKDPEAPIEPLFADERWNRVSSSAPQQSWLAALRLHGFPCAALPRTDPVQDLVGIGQITGAEREVLLPLTIWLASTLRSKGTGDARMADRGPLTWAPIQLSQYVHGSSAVYIMTNVLNIRIWTIKFGINVCTCSMNIDFV